VQTNYALAFQTLPPHDGKIRRMANGRDSLKEVREDDAAAPFFCLACCSAPSEAPPAEHCARSDSPIRHCQYFARRIGRRTRRNLNPELAAVCWFDRSAHLRLSRKKALAPADLFRASTPPGLIRAGEKLATMALQWRVVAFAAATR